MCLNHPIQIIPYFYRRNQRPGLIHGGPIIEPTYENFPSALQKKRQRDRSAGAVSLGGATKFNGTTECIDDPDHIYQNPARLRGSSVDRHRKFYTEFLNVNIL